MSVKSKDSVVANALKYAAKDGEAVKNAWFYKDEDVIYQGKPAKILRIEPEGHYMILLPGGKKVIAKGRELSSPVGNADNGGDVSICNVEKDRGLCNTCVFNGGCKNGKQQCTRGCDPLVENGECQRWSADSFTRAVNEAVSHLSGEKTVKNMSTQEAITAIELLLGSEDPMDHDEAQQILKHHQYDIRRNVGDWQYRDLYRRAQNSAKTDEKVMKVSNSFALKVANAAVDKFNTFTDEQGNVCVELKKGVRVTMNDLVRRVAVLSHIGM